MEWRELTNHQKLCRITLSPETTVVQIYQMIAALTSPWKDADAGFSWSIEPGYILKVHAQKHGRKA